MNEPWWDVNTFGALYGSIAGGGLGTLGGLWGALGGVLAPKGKGRAVVLGLGWLLFAVGVSQLAFGLYALAAGQPYGIWYGPCLTGVIIPVVVGSLIPVVRKRYAEAEDRRMQAEGFRAQ